MSKEVVFKQSCLIRKNTPGLRDKLSDLGYKVHRLSETEDREYGILCNGKVAVGIPDNCREFNLDKYLKNNPQIIDCGKDEDLFLAIAALRDDSDIHQWFKSNFVNEFIKCDYDEFHLFTFNPLDALDHNDLSIYYHKATIKELIDHFKKTDMFTYPCFIRSNTKRLRDKLEELGYKFSNNGVNEWHIPIEELSCLGANIYVDGYYMGISEYWNYSWIDCGTNEALFLAIAALRDDSDIHQWFVNENKSCWWKCSLNEFKQDFEASNEDKNLSYKYFHKATIDELINFFKK